MHWWVSIENKCNQIQLQQLGRQFCEWDFVAAALGRFSEFRFEGVLIPTGKVFNPPHAFISKSIDAAAMIT